MKVKDDNYYVVQGWMITKLKLKGLEKDLFAIIHGFTQDGNTNFYGSLEYLSEMTGYTRNRVCSALKHLIDMHYLDKEVEREGAVKHCYYKVNIEVLETHSRPKDLDGRPKDLDGKDEKNDNSRPKDLDVYITDNKKIDNKEDNKDVRQKPAKFVETNSANNTVQEFVDIYNNICIDNPTLSKPRVITEKRKKAVLTILKKYGKNSIIEVLDKVSKSDFLLGKTGGTWHINFDWIFNETNFVKILEGNYDGSYKKKSKINELPCNRNVRSRSVDKEEAARVRRKLEEAGEKVEY